MFCSELANQSGGVPAAAGNRKLPWTQARATGGEVGMGGTAETQRVQAGRGQRRRALARDTETEKEETRKR